MTAIEWSAVLGFIAIPLSILRFQINSRNILLMSTLPLVALIATSYWLRGEYQGASVAMASASMAMLQGLLGLGRHKHHYIMGHLRVALAMVAITCAAILTPPDSWITAIPFLSFAVAKWADHYMSPFKVRRTILWATALWGVYAGLTHNPEIVALEVLTLASNLWWLWRNRNKEEIYEQSPHLTKI
jgi:hypothetical protein